MSNEEEFPRKHAKRLPENYEEKVESLSKEELEAEILKAEKASSDCEHDMENDPKLNVLKEDVKILAGGYKEVIMAEKAKIKYCLFLLRSRGQG